MRLLLLTFLGALAPSTSIACSCHQLSVQEKLSYSNSAILARIVNIEYEKQSKGTISWERQIATLQVIQNLRGEHKEGELILATTGGPCAYFFNDKYDHLIYLSNTQEGLSTNMCSGNRMYPLGKMSKIVEEEMMLIEIMLSKKRNLNQAVDATSADAAVASP